MDYPEQDFTKLKYSDVLTLILQRDQSHLDSYTDVISTWLYPKIFHHWIKNSSSPISKHSELFASHHGDLRSERYLYPYPLQATFDSRVLHSWSRLVRCTSTSHLYVISVSPHFLVKRTTNPYGIQWSILDIAIILIIAYHLVVNKFKD